jgi:hypothetical protein
VSIDGDQTDDLRRRLSVVEAENRKLKRENAALAKRAQPAPAQKPDATPAEPSPLVDGQDGEFGW